MGNEFTNTTANRTLAARLQTFQSTETSRSCILTTYLFAVAVSLVCVSRDVPLMSSRQARWSAWTSAHHSTKVWQRRKPAGQPGPGWHLLLHLIPLSTYPLRVSSALLVEAVHGTLSNAGKVLSFIPSHLFFPPLFVLGKG